MNALLKTLYTNRTSLYTALPLLKLPVNIFFAIVSFLTADTTMSTALNIYDQLRRPEDPSLRQRAAKSAKEALWWTFTMLLAWFALEPDWNWGFGGLVAGVVVGFLCDEDMRRVMFGFFR